MNQTVPPSNTVIRSKITHKIVDADRTSAGVVEISVTQLFGDYFTFQSGFILLAKPLDREERHVLQLSVHTCDRGQPISCNQTIMNFVITDVNDNAPFFTKAFLVFEISHVLSNKIF